MAGPDTSSPARRGYDADMPAIMSVMERAFDPRHGEAWTLAQCLATLALPGYRWLVSQGPGGAIAGFLLARTVMSESEMMLLAVLPRSRCQGIGRALVRRWLDDARDDGVERVFLEVRADNRAIGLYRDFGFIETGRRPDYYLGTDGARLDAISMAFDLQVKV